MTWVYPLDFPHGRSLAEWTAVVGGKAANLGVMARELGLTVPPGMVVTTAACRAYLAGGWPAELESELRTGMTRIEASVGRRFGDPTDPLLLSVRSGAPISMPGMMDTILDLGLNEDTERGLAATAGGPEFAADCRERFRAMFRETVCQDAPDDPWLQLRLAVEAVFRSWNGDRARAYRQKERIPDDLGTGVTVQAMVFGNRGPDSATGVVFTRNPATGQAGLYGDVLFSAQGEDVVAGTHATLPIAALDEWLPAAAAALREAAARLERHYADLCDIEFTIEQGRLWLLQVRVGKRSTRAALRIALDMAQDPDFPLTREQAVRRVATILADPPRSSVQRPAGARTLAVGLGASPGMASGEICLTPDAAARLADAGRTAILVRAETSPEDVHGMARAVGILTQRGGLASHAAVVARGWGIPAVVGANSVEVGVDEVRIRDQVLHPGDVITIDGDTGEVFIGSVSAASAVVPEATVLLAWAGELGVPIDRAPTEVGPPDGSPQDEAGTAAPSPAERLHAPTPEDVLQVVGIKGVASREAIAAALACSGDAVQPALDQLVRSDLARTVAGAYQLNDAGTSAREQLLTDERQALGPTRAATALDDFVHLDGRVKAVVTDWQLRSTPGEPVLNDHADADYDRSVIERLAAVHADALAWLAPLEGHWRRADRYRIRLDSALSNVRAGDARYVASPRVDSYHGVWFELHEDLILLAGRTRAAEVAAGRA